MWEFKMECGNDNEEVCNLAMENRCCQPRTANYYLPTVQP
jgi:hypothetical protein